MCGNGLDILAEVFILLMLKGRKRVKFIDAFILIKRRQMWNIKFIWGGGRTSIIW